MSNWRDPEWRKAQLAYKEHQASYEGDFMLDEFVCTCGWKSGPFFDGARYAEEAAQRHIAEVKSNG